MALLNRIVNNIRNTIGLDTTADSLDRKIDSLNSKEKQSLTIEKFNIDSSLDEINYDMRNLTNELEKLNSIVQNIARIETIAENEIAKIDSQFQGIIDSYKGNIFSLRNYINNFKVSNFNKWLELQKTLNQLKTTNKIRYINSVLCRLVDDSGKTVTNEEISQLYEIIKMDVSSVKNLFSNFNNYYWLEDINKKSLNLINQLEIAIHRQDIQKSNIESEKYLNDYNLRIIEQQKQALRYTKEYLEKDKDRKRMEGRRR